MASSFLCPPNVHALSDNVIGGVVQRVTPFHRRLDHSCRTSTTTQQLNVPQQQLQSAIGHKRPPPLQKRQRKHAEDLDSSIQQLRDEIQELETQRQVLLRCAPASESVWIVATEYFRLFRQGCMAPVKAPDMVSSSSANHSQAVSRLKQAHAQLDFLRATMSPDVTDGSACGPDAILKHWKLLSLYHGDVHVQLKRLRQDSGSGSVVATTRVGLTITEKSLRYIYPHLSADSSDSTLLAKKLLNQRLVMRGSVRFDWDDNSGQVVRMETKIDMMSAMIKLLGNLGDVVRVFEKAAITPEGRFIDRSSSSSASATSLPLQSQREQ
ncbi:hypothetical protein PF010_g24136 [Phytophthora fragariae]|uniref:Bzip transcription factor n=1 Tax=Phytophthora fragariae TaxID=53985 RepID=A0A6G0K3G7_9STRA|nr:hypothetical protein PF010_g24136 [Phytophthora fragariae]